MTLEAKAEIATAAIKTERNDIVFVVDEGRLAIIGKVAAGEWTDEQVHAISRALAAANVALGDMDPMYCWMGFRSRDCNPMMDPEHVLRGRLCDRHTLTTI